MLCFITLYDYTAFFSVRQGVLEKIFGKFFGDFCANPSFLPNLAKHTVYILGNFRYNMLI